MVSVWWVGLLVLAAITAVVGQWLQRRLDVTAGVLEQRRQSLGALRPALVEVRDHTAALAERSHRGIGPNPG